MYLLEELDGMKLERIFAGDHVMKRPLLLFID